MTFFAKLTNKKGTLSLFDSEGTLIFPSQSHYHSRQGLMPFLLTIIKKGLLRHIS